MPLADHEFITCPGCDQKLLASATRCHFCGADTSAVDRVAAPVKKSMDLFNVPAWTEQAFEALGAWWVISGILIVCQILGEAYHNFPRGFTAFEIGPLLLGLGVAALGVTLFRKVDEARKVTRVASVLLVIWGIQSIVGLVASHFAHGLLGFAQLLEYVLDVGAGGCTLWLLWATDLDFR